MSAPRFELIYWPIPFRGCFVSYVLAYRGVPFVQNSDAEQIVAEQEKDPAHQAIPFMGPPILVDHEAGCRLTQTPAILLYLANELDLWPTESFARAMQMKVVMDCNDLLMEICCSNGSRMWESDAWNTFRTERLPRWLAIFERSLSDGIIAGDAVGIADLATCALLGNMARCLPELAPDIQRGAPNVFSHCASLMSEGALREHVHQQKEDYGEIYCGGQIEASIRRMLSEG